MRTGTVMVLRGYIIDIVIFEYFEYFEDVEVPQKAYPCTPHLALIVSYCNNGSNLGTRSRAHECRILFPTYNPSSRLKCRASLHINPASIGSDELQSAESRGSIPSSTH